MNTRFQILGALAVILFGVTLQPLQPKLDFSEMYASKRPRK